MTGFSSIPTPLSWITGCVDTLLHTIASSSLLASFLGLSLLCPNFDLVSRHFINTNMHKHGLTIVSWDVKTPFERNWLLDQGCSSITDSVFPLKCPCPSSSCGSATVSEGDHNNNNNSKTMESKAESAIVENRIVAEAVQN